MTIRYAPHLLALLLASSALIGCSSDGGDSTPTIPSYTVSASVVGTGGVIAPDSQTVAKDANAIFELTPDANYVIDTVTGCGDTGTVSGNTYTTGPVTADCALEATFKLTSYTVSATATPGGTITPASATVTHGETTSVTVAPDSGFAVSGVTASGCTIDPVTYVTGFITADCAITASFTLDAGATPLALGYDIKQLTFNWPAVSGATTYKLMKDPTGASGYAQLGVDLTTTSAIDDIAVHLHDWPNTSYMVQACNDNGCVDTNEVDTFDSLVEYAKATNAIGYVKASNTAAGDLFGTALSVSGDGNTLAIGAPRKPFWDAATSTEAGGVHVYTRNGGVWAHQAYLQAPVPDPEDFFGSAVALSYDGNTLAVGAAEEASGNAADQNDDTVADAGAVYVFNRNATGTWGEPAYLKASPINGSAFFGYALALSNTGDTLAVGAFGENTEAGAVYVFNRVDTAWGSPERIIATTRDSYDNFGYGLAISGDGNTLAVGAFGEDSLDGLPTNDDLSATGAVYVVTRGGDGTWSVPEYMKASNIEDGALFGVSVALNDDGSILAVGANREDGTATDAGAVYVFTHNGVDWDIPVYLKAANAGFGDRFGSAVALSGDGTILTVGAQFELSGATGLNGDEADTQVTGSGAGYLFTRDSVGIWSQKTYIKAPNTGEGDFFGGAIALSGDGQTLMVGAEEEDSSAKGICATADAACADATTGQGNNGAAEAGAVYLY